MPDQTTEAVRQLLEHSEVTMWVVTIQLIAAVLMILVEACLLWGILKATRVLDRKVSPAVEDLIKKIQYLTLKVEFMMKITGFESATDAMEDGEDNPAVAKLREAQREAGLSQETGG